MDGFTGDEKRHRLVVLAFFDGEFFAGTQAKAIQEFQKLAVLFVNTNNFGFVPGAKFRERNNALFAKLRNAAANGDAVRTGAVVSEAFQEELLDFG